MTELEVYRAIKTMRAVRQFAEREVSNESMERILEAGRWSGSSKNAQPWHFILIRKRETLSELSKCGYYASHLREAAFGVGVVSKPGSDFDCGRCIQNMMLAAWGESIGSCIASMHRESKAKKLLGVPASLRMEHVVSFGYPRLGVTPTIEGKPLEDVLSSLGRKPLNELVHYEKW